MAGASDLVLNNNTLPVVDRCAKGSRGMGEEREVRNNMKRHGSHCQHRHILV